MNLKTLFARAALRHPKLCAEIDEKRAVALLRAVCDDLLAEMNRIEDGRIPIYRFGEFIIETEPTGKKVIRFLPELPKPSSPPGSPSRR